MDLDKLTVEENEFLQNKKKWLSGKPVDENVVLLTMVGVGVLDILWMLNSSEIGGSLFRWIFILFFLAHSVLRKRKREERKYISIIDKLTQK